MKFGSVCSGIEAASVAWHPLGWTTEFVSEIEPFPSAVLAHHYPNTPNYGDMTKFEDWPDATLDVLVGGTPCQSFSVAGLRKGLDDPRGNLMLTFGAIARRYRPTWLVWENVPGVLSSNGGRDFGTFLGMLGELGYGFSYRVLDAQYFGVAQRRRRVFVVGCLGNWRRAAAVLFERHSLSGNPPPSRESRKVAPTIPSRSTGGGGLGTDFDCDGGLIVRAVSLRGREGGGTAELGDDLQNCLRASGGGGDKPHVLIHADPIARCVTAGEAKRQDWETCNFVAHSLRGEGFDASEDGTGRGTPLVPVAFSCKDYGADAGEVAPTLRSMGHNKSHANAGGQVAIAFNARQDPDCWHDRPGPLDTDGGTQAISYAIQAGALRTNPASGPDGVGVQADHAYTLEARAEVQAVAVRDVAQTVTSNYGKQCDNSDTALGPNVAIHSMQVRRLTPTECARLQGFPDNHLDILYRGKPAADGPKYKALGNSMAVPVMRWIGERIQEVAA